MKHAEREISSRRRRLGVDTAFRPRLVVRCTPHSLRRKRPVNICSDVFRRRPCAGGVQFLAIIAICEREVLRVLTGTDTNRSPMTFTRCEGSL